jgi:hypothetical protein
MQPLFCTGLDPSGYRNTSSHHDDETDALLGGQALMADEERFKVKIIINSPFGR